MARKAVYNNLKTKKPSKQRKRAAKAPLHQKRKRIRAHLSKACRESLMNASWNTGGRPIRTLPVRKDDKVIVLTGMKQAKGKPFRGKVTSVDTKRGLIVVDKVTTTKADGTKVPKPLHPSNVIIDELDLSDDYRKEMIRRIARGGKRI